MSIAVKRIGPDDHGKRMRLAAFEHADVVEGYIKKTMTPGASGFPSWSSRSPRSGPRDYDEQPEEYLAIGVHEYWIIDARKQAMLALRRRAGVWEEQHVKASETYRTPLLPGFKLELKAVLGVGKGKGRRTREA